MSNYAATGDGLLLVSWPSGPGSSARVVAHSPDSPPAMLLQLAGELTALSQACWRVYTDPVTRDPILGDVDARADLDGVAALITSPELPDEHGYVTSSYIAVVELAQRAARTCHTLGDPQLTAAVSADVQAEVTAVLAADRGDLSGRGRQATLLSRTEVSPAQVDAASRQLAANPLDGTALLTDFDPAAAGVAAATWLNAAAAVAAEQAQLADPSMVIHHADDIDAMPVQTLTTALDMLVEHDPYEVVAYLVDEARAVSAGLAPNVYQLEQNIHEARTLAGRLARTESDVDSVLGQVRLCVLDPLRPAPDLLEDLLTGIYACWLIWDEATPDAIGKPAGVRPADDHGNPPADQGHDIETRADHDEDLEDLDEPEDPAWTAARRQRFTDAVRARVAADAQ